MPNLQQKVTNSFIKGLITEAGELTFPENASVDEINCELYRDGSRRRRKGIVLEDNNSYSSFSVAETTVVTSGDWDNVGNDASKSYLVTQVGARLYFYNKGEFPYSAQELTESVDLTPYEVAGSLGIASNDCQFTSILGTLVVVNKAMEPILITENSGVFSVEQLDCYIRDFEWKSDKSTLTSAVVTADKNRRYDTANSGWTGEKGSAALTDYISGEGTYPPLTHPWYSGKNSDGDFDRNEWKRVYSGSSLIGNGHFILDLFYRDRSGVSGIAGFDVELETSRFTTTMAFAGRVFFAGLSSSKNSGKVFYSQVLQDRFDMGYFYQQNDPTAEIVSDLLETDGGYISIPDARNIKKLYAFRNSLFVFAENGVWQVKGVDDVFSPTAYSISKITELGIGSPGSFTSAEGAPFWWSRHGIHTMSFDEFGAASEQNLSISTIQTFWNRLDSNARETVKASYDRVNKKILWLYKDNNEQVVNKYNNVLILDVTLQAFYPWRFEDPDLLDNYVTGFSFYSGLGAAEVTLNVITNEGNTVVVGSDTVVVDLITPLSNSSISTVFLVRDTSRNKLTMAIVRGTGFLDWNSTNYVSFAITGYDFTDSLVVKKTAPYIVFYLRETETGWTINGDTSISPIGESSMYVTCYWDFKKLPSSIPQQAYKRQQPIIADESNLNSFGSPASVITSRLKVRGRGRSLSLKFESEEGKDFIYLGHGLITDASSRF